MTPQISDSQASRTPAGGALIARLLAPLFLFIIAINETAYLEALRAFRMHSSLGFTWVHGVVVFIGLILFYAIYTMFVTFYFQGPVAIVIGAVIGTLLLLFLLFVIPHAKKTS